MPKYSKIYVLAPFGGATGGVELGHQLVDYLRQKKENAYIVYVDTNCNPTQAQDVTKSYEKYDIKSTNVIEDSEKNVLVVPEVFFDSIYLYKKIHIACWWMSVDNRYNRSSLKQQLSFRKGMLGKCKCLFNWIKAGFKTICKNDNRLLKKNDCRLIHLYQSAYAQHHLYSLGFSVVLPLSDFINTELVGNLERKRMDTVLYNPAKGYKFTKKIMSMLPNVKFIPLKGLSRNQLREYMETSKLYIDFGNFPGKDRLPREAVTNGCCVITGKEGASFFFEDVPILAGYKFDVKSSNLPKIASKIRFVLENYNECCRDFDSYRQRVSLEQKSFYAEIDRVFL